MITSKTTSEVRVFTDEGEVKPHFSKLLQNLGTKIAFVRIEHAKGVLTLGLKSAPGKHAGQRIHIRWSDGTEIVTPRRVTNETKILETLRCFFQNGEAGDFFVWDKSSKFTFDYEDKTYEEIFVQEREQDPEKNPEKSFIICSECNKEASPSAMSCPHCGNSFGISRPRGFIRGLRCSPTVKICAGLWLVALLMWGIAKYLEVGLEKQKRQEAAILAQEKAKKQREEQEAKAKQDAIFSPSQPSARYTREMEKIEMRRLHRNVKAIREAYGYEE